jgi:hypothetical protein
VAFNLKRLVKGLYDDINMSDGGRTHSTPPPARTAVATAPPPRPASTSRPSLSVQPVNRPTLNMAQMQPVAPPKPLPVITAPLQNLQVGQATIAPSLTHRTASPSRQAFIDNQQNHDAQLMTKLGNKLETPLNVIKALPNPYPVHKPQEIADITHDFVTRPLAQIAATISGTPQVKPTNNFSRVLLGDKPVNSLQQSWQDARKANVNIPFTDTRIPTPIVQAGDLAFNLANDIPDVGVIAKGAAKGIKAAAPITTKLVESANTARTPLNEAGYARIPKGKLDPAPDLNPTQKEFVNQYAEMLQGMEGGQGGLMIPTEYGGYTRTTANTPFYSKVYAETGRPPTKEAYFQEARKQIESGKAAYGASDEFAAIPKTTAPSPTTKLVTTAKTCGTNITATIICCQWFRK